MSQLLKNLTITDVEELIINPAAFTIQDVIGIAKLLKRSPIEIFELILNELKEEANEMS